MAGWEPVGEEYLPSTPQQQSDPWKPVGEEPLAASSTSAASADDPWKPVGEEPLRATFGQSVARGVDQLQGMLYGAAEAAGEVTGSQGLTEFGREGRVRNEAEARAAAPPKQTFLGVRGAGDFLQWAKETVGEQLPMMAPSLGGAAVGAGVGAFGGPASPLTVPIGAAIGAFIPGLAMGVGEVQSTLKEKNADATAGASVFVGGSAIAALDSVIPGRIGSLLVKSLGKQVAEEVAKRTLAKGVAVEAGKQMGIEGLTEAVQEAIGEVAGSIGAGTPIDWQGLPTKAIEAGAAGALLGGFTGGLTGAATTRTHQPSPRSGNEPSDGSIAASSAESAATVEPGAIRVVDNPDQQADAQVFEDTPQPGPVFYSQIERLVQEKGPSFASTEQWLNTIRNAPGVKAEEIEWLRLPEYLADKAGRVSKADLLTHIRENLVDVQTIEWTASAVEPLKWGGWSTQQEDSMVTADGNYLIQQEGGRYFTYFLNDPEGSVEVNIGPSNGIPSLQRAQEYAQAHASRLASEAEGQGTRYQDYQLEGEKQSYTELLLWWNRDAGLAPLQKARDDAAAALEAFFRKMEDARGGRSPMAWEYTPEEAAEYARLDKAETDAYEAFQAKLNGRTQPFLGGHWEESNVLAHVRASRRKDVEGKDTLYVEEIQSDWHQQGRKQGYAGQQQSIPSRAEVNGAEAAYQNLANEFWAAVHATPGFAGMTDTTIMQFRRNYEATPFVDNNYTTLEGLRELAGRVDTAARHWADLDTRRFSEPSRIPNAPFKGAAWTELAIKRILRYAADQGIERVAFTSPSIQKQRWQAHEGGQRAAGFDEFYGKIVPRIVEKWAKKLGGRTGMTSIPTGMTVQPTSDQDMVGAGGMSAREPALFVDVTPSMASRIKLGFTTFDIRAVNDQGPAVAVTGPTGSPLLAAAKEAGKVVQELAKRFNIQKKININVNLGAGRVLGNVAPEGVPQDDLLRAVETGAMSFEAAQQEWKRRALNAQATSYTLNIWPDMFETVEEMYSTMMHELGHIVDFEFFRKASPETQLAVKAAYQKWFAENSRGDRKFRELLVSRQIFIRAHYGFRSTFQNDPMGGDELVSSMRNASYWLSFEEWMAENVGKWLVTDEKPLSVVDRFFSALARRIRELRDAFAKRFGLNVDPPQALTKWLDSLITLEPLDYGAAEAERNRKTQEANQKAAAAAGHPDFPAVPMTPESAPIRRMLKKLGLGGHVGAGMHLAAADRFNTFYKYMLSLNQVAARNFHVAPLQRYRELWQLKQLERVNLMNVALETKRLWAKLSAEQQKKLGQTMDYYANGHFLPDDEAASGVVRRPTIAEEDAMRRKFGLNDDAFGVFKKVQADFDLMLNEVRKVELAEAALLTDPAAQARAVNATNTKFDEFGKRPYMPFMRYGEFTLTVRDASGAMTGFYTFESQGKRKAGRKVIEHDLLPGETISEGVLPEEVRPLVGLPPGLLDKVRDRLGLTPSQISALEQLKFEFAPVQSFKHRFSRRAAIPGYSLDFQRGYMNYFFYGANYLSNVKYAQPLLDQIKAVRDSARPLADGTRRGRIANFMTDHYHFTMNPKADWATFRQAATLWALGAVPAAATLNLSQMVVGSYPFLAAKFGGIGVGDVKAIRALTKAGTQLSTFYRRGKYEGATEQDFRAINEGVKEGIITEAQAHELAAAAETDNLKPHALSRTRDTWNWVVEKSMWMFEMTEQMNRRITFRAAWRLALENPSAPYIASAIAKHQLAYERLLEKGWQRNEAAAFVVAKDAVEETQYIYQQWANPRFMRGKARTIFLFKSFVQNTLFMLWNNPGARARSLLVMAFLGGLMGMPGGEDLRGIIKALAYRLFGKDFDIEEEARRFVIDVLDSKIPPDLILHGAARRGFGLPAAMDLLGVPAPTFDRSRAVGLGSILPLDFGVLAGPHKDTSRAIAESAQKASGAAFGVGFNLYKFLTDSQLDWSDSKRWQMALPRSLQGATKAWRYYSREGETNRFGNLVVRFDTDDPRHMAEIIGAAGGYTPMRLAAQWDRIIAEREAVMYWNIRRETLMRQLWAARGDSQQYEGVLQSIRNFNAQLPDAAALKRITADSIKRSFQARARAQQAQESGTPRVRADVPIVRDIQRLYPEAEVDVRRVR